jgi:hypothetical protein
LEFIIFFLLASFIGAPSSRAKFIYDHLPLAHYVHDIPTDRRMLSVQANVIGLNLSLIMAHALIVDDKTV